MIKKNPIFIYPAVFKKEDQGYTVSFIDFCWHVEGKTLEDAMKNAEEALCQYISRLGFAKAVNCPITTDRLSGYVLKYNEFISLVKVDIIDYLKRTDSKAIRKNVTIPSWLCMLAEKENLNFSQILQDALKKELNVDF